MSIWDNDSNKKDYGNSNKDKNWSSKPNETSTWVVNVDKKDNSSSWKKISEKKEWF